MLCFSELEPEPDFSKLDEFMPEFAKLRPRDHKPPLVTPDKIKELFQGGWRINYIRRAVYENLKLPDLSELKSEDYRTLWTTQAEAKNSPQDEWLEWHTTYMKLLEGKTKPGEIHRAHAWLSSISRK
jgi:hypothetical protein